eukprot:5897098-Prymnesium_polylepis.1
MTSSCRTRPPRSFVRPLRPPARRTRKDKAAVLSRLLRETAPLDPNNPALTDFEGAVAASLQE